MKRLRPKIKKYDDEKIIFHYIDESPGKESFKFIKIVLATTKISELPIKCLKTEKKSH